MAIDTIFICFCEDSDKNDGIKKPYYMSVGLMVRASFVVKNIFAVSCFKNVLKGCCFTSPKISGICRNIIVKKAIVSPAIVYALQ